MIIRLLIIEYQRASIFVIADVEDQFLIKVCEKASLKCKRRIIDNTQVYLSF